MTDILAALQARGFFPNERYDNWFDLAIGQTGALSVPRSIVVHLLTGNRVAVSDVRLSQLVPMSIVTAVIDLTIASAVTG